MEPSKFQLPSRDLAGVWESKVGRTALLAVLANPIIMLVLQIMFPLEKLGVVSDKTGDLTLLFIHAFLLILMGNFAVVQQPGRPRGLRNRWTLACKSIWMKTHRFFGFGLVTALFFVAPLAAVIDLESGIMALILLLIAVYMLATLYSWRLGSSRSSSSMAQ